jgi:hypothetical protein
MAAHHPAYHQADFFGQRDQDLDFAADLKPSIGEKEQSTVGDVLRGGSNTMRTASDRRRSFVANPLVISSFLCSGFSHGHLRLQAQIVQSVGDESVVTANRGGAVPEYALNSVDGILNLFVSADGMNGSHGGNLLQTVADMVIQLANCV